MERKIKAAEAKRRNKMCRTIQLQNKDNTKKVMYIDDTGQIYKDEFIFKEKMSVEKEGRHTKKKSKN